MSATGSMVQALDTASASNSELAPSEVRSRAASGAATLVMRGMAVRVISFGGNAVLARLLLPQDFGVVAFGLTAMNAISFLGDGGLGGALLRRREGPTSAELRALLGTQLLVTSVLALFVWAFAWRFGEVGTVTALMVMALPIVSFRVPGSIVLERDLRFRPLAFVELGETASYTIWSLATVILGWGVWGIASAVIVRAVVGSVVILVLAPVHIIVPRLSWRVLRPLLGFGIRMQAQRLTNLVRDQGLNVGTAAIGGVATLGMWSLASRIMNLPFLLFDSLWRVSYPAMARLLAAGEEPRPIIERSLRVSTALTGLMLVAMVGGGGALLPTIFGSQWTPAASVIPFAGLAILLMGPISVSTAGYLYAIGKPSTVLCGTVSHTVAWGAVGLSLMPAMGVRALGVGWLAAGVVEACVLGRGVAKAAGARVARSIGLPVVAATCAGAAGWFVAAGAGPSGLEAGTLGGMTAVVGYVAIVVAADARLAREVAGMVKGATRRAVRRAA